PCAELARRAFASSLLTCPAFFSFHPSSVQSPGQESQGNICEYFCGKVLLSETCIKATVIPSILVPVTCRREVWIQTSARSFFFHLPGIPGLQQ
ncbi:hypothetical protein HGM15179_008869, partial [Zosterops borbonicus]